MNETNEIISIYNKLQEKAKNEITIPALYDVSIKNFAGEEKILFMVIAENVIRLIESDESIKSYLEDKNNVIDKIKLALEELDTNREVFNILLSIQRNKVDSELAKLYLVKLLYDKE